MSGVTARAGREVLSPIRRFVAVLSTWLLLNLAQPGLLRPDGFGHFAFFALGPWAYAASRPGRRAFVAEWAAHAFGLLGWFLWMRHLLPWLLVPMAVVPALWLTLGGVLLRRLARRWPLALAAPVAWLSAELVRWYLPVPFSFGWLRTGELLHDTLWLSGSARVFGVFGLTYVVGALGGLAADWAASRGGAPARGAVALGLGPLAAAVAASLAVPAPPVAGDCSVVVAQPGIEQSIKGGRAGVESYMREEFGPLVEETLAALAEIDGERAGQPGDRASGDARGAPDFVLFGESILLGRIVPPEVRAAHARGVRPPPSSPERDLSREELEAQGATADVLAGALFGAAEGSGGDARRRAAVADWLFGALDTPWARRVRAGERLLPPGTRLLAGVEAWHVEGDALRRRNVLALYGTDGALAGTASKVRLVPGGESVEGVRWFPFVVTAVRRVGGYVPDFVGAGETEVLAAELADGRTVRIGCTICYDNAFDAPYVAPLRRGPVDWFVVASNEAWYEDSLEMDHMLAMARMRALTTGRAVVRATNSGISAVIAGDGRDVAVLEVEGRRKMVRGHLAARVPLPADPAGRTVYVRTARAQLALFVLAAIALTVLARRPDGFAPDPGNPARAAG